jgi:2-amino-4-hydroxy-6-hydroxymethyldihydropteridine diphosphokinase
MERTGMLGLGSNVGERRAHLQAAVYALPGAGVSVLASSSTYDTDPVGEVLDQASFLNACLCVRTALAPLELLGAVKRVERALGRSGDGVRHGPRTIDIDVLLLGDVELRDERIFLPHAQLEVQLEGGDQHEAPRGELRLPDGVRLADALAALPVDEGVRWAGPPLSLPAR